MGFLPLLLLSLSLLISLSGGEISPEVGVCYGLLGNNLPPPSKSVELLKSLKAKSVKLYNPKPEILNALKGTDLQVTIMFPNEILVNISTNQTLANHWVHTNVSPFYPQVQIRYILVGNEILSNKDNVSHFSLVPAMRLIETSLKSMNFKKIKVGTPSAMDVLESSFPPSIGTFRSDISGPIMKPLLHFLNQTKSSFFLDVYTFYPWASDPINIKLGYALLKAKNITYTDPGTGFTYHNLLDQIDGGANLTELGSVLAYACGQGNGTCDAIRPGGKCFKPDSLVWHASYAFSSYCAQFRKVGGSCLFNGLAVQTTKDPSYGSCKFPSITLTSAGK